MPILDNVIYNGIPYNIGSSQSGDGLTPTQKNLFIEILRNALYSTDQSDNIDVLENSFARHCTAISLNKSTISFGGLNLTQQLTATLTPPDTTDTVAWSSSNTSVATVDSESDLSDLAGYEPGSVAYTAGFKAMWQLSADGTWVSVI